MAGAIILVASPTPQRGSSAQPAHALRIASYSPGIRDAAAGNYRRSGNPEPDVLSSHNSGTRLLDFRRSYYGRPLTTLRRAPPG